MLFAIIQAGSAFALAEGCFEGCKFLKKVIISTTAPLDIIEKNAFKGCVNLTTLTLSENIKAINEHAFENCTSLKSVVLPSNLNTLEENSFIGCNMIQNVHFCSDNSGVINNMTNAFPSSTATMTIFVKETFNNTTNVSNLNLRRVLTENCLLVFKPTYCEPKSRGSKSILPIFLLIEDGMKFKHKHV